MSYTPTEWKSGDTITSAKLNKIENGIAAAGSGGVGTVRVELNKQETGRVMDKTWAEIKNMFDSGLLIQIIENDDEGDFLAGFVAGAGVLPFGNESYVIYTIVFAEYQAKSESYFTDSENGYPEYLFEGEE